MTANQIARSMERINDSPFIKLKDIARMVGDSNTQKVKRTYLDGLQNLNGRYFVPEVAERIKERMTVV